MKNLTHENFNEIMDVLSTAIEHISESEGGDESETLKYLIQRETELYAKFNPQ